MTASRHKILAFLHDYYQCYKYNDVMIYIYIHVLYRCWRRAVMNVVSLPWLQIYVCWPRYPIHGRPRRPLFPGLDIIYPIWTLRILDLANYWIGTRNASDWLTICGNVKRFIKLCGHDINTALITFHELNYIGMPFCDLL